MSEFTNPLDALLDVINTKTAEANAIAQEAQSASGNHAKDVREARENSTDEKIVKFREWEEQHNAAMLAALDAINKYIVDSGIVAGAVIWSAETLAEKKSEHKALSKIVKDARKTIEVMYSSVGMPVPEFPALTSFSGGKASTGGSSGTRRPRFGAITLNGVALEGKNGSRPNLSLVSGIIRAQSGLSMGAGEILDTLASQNGMTVDDVLETNDVSALITHTDEKGIVHEFALTVYRLLEEDDTAAE